MTIREITQKNPFKLCFVCLGNICRSPTAEGIMQHLVNDRQLEAWFEIDSAGMSAYHRGEGANVHSQNIANRHGVKLRSRSRQLEPFDLDYFDLIIGMDHSNITSIYQLAANSKYHQKIKLLREYDPSPDNQDVPDPYDGGLKGFEHVFDVIHRSCESLLNELESKIHDS